MENLLLHLEM